MANRPVYNVPVPSVLTAITPNSIGLRTNQIVGLFIQLIGTPFPDEATMKLKASWDALIAASDSTKVVFTPPFSNPKFMQSKELETGQDTNATYEGIPEYFGEGTVKVTIEFHNIDSASLASMNYLYNLSKVNSANQAALGAYFLNNDGQFFCQDDFSPFRIINFTLRTRGTEGLNASDIIGASFYLKPYWSDDMIPVVPSFDPRLYIANA